MTLASEQAPTVLDVTDIRDRVVLDLFDVMFADSAGVGLLLDIARNHSRPLRLERVPDNVRRVLEITRLAQVFEVAE